MEESFAREDPRAFFSRDPLADAWGLVEVDPETGRPVSDEPPIQPVMLYLDKCWRELQGLLRSEEPGVSRPAYDLVDGQVTMTSEGWLPHFGVLDSVKVAEIAADLSAVTEEHVDTWLNDEPVYPDHDEKGYIMDFLGRAQAFTALMTTRGLGLIYMIG